MSKFKPNMTTAVDFRGNLGNSWEDMKRTNMRPKRPTTATNAEMTQKVEAVVIQDRCEISTISMALEISVLTLHE